MNKEMQKFVQIYNNRMCDSVFNKLERLGYHDNFLDASKEEIEQIILKLKPRSKRSIITLCSMFNSYAKFIGNVDACQIIQKIDKSLLWEMAKPNAEKKYISHSTYESILEKIGLLEEINVLYNQALFRVVYEGVYCGDMSVVFNLRLSDIHDNTVELHPNNGKPYDLILPENLIEDLKELAELDEYECKNKYGVFRVEATGKYPDSCFKIRSRKDDYLDATYRFGYYNRLRNIIKKYLGYNLSPTQLFISGIMYRISLELENNNIPIEQAFAGGVMEKRVSNIITKELHRCKHNISVNAFRELVTPHLEIFIEEN
ncbi:MAG: hypothetical protein HFH60_02700 [Lachnospiraceae bacterium]|nr:hypothetical protein [Lachnospiraceae bacterium]MCI9545590.1 hypothetical protein [Lachnospiraceae bacterium]